jgi:hypothetical protein
MGSLPFVIFFKKSGQDQPLFTRFVKGLGEHCSHRPRRVAFFNRAIR